MNVRKLGTNILTTMATAACIAGGIKSYNNHVEQTIETIQYDLKHNPKDSIFWTRNCGPDRYVSEQKRIQAQIDYNAVNEPLVSKIDFWENIKFHIEKDQSMRQDYLLETRYLKKKWDSGLRQIYRFVKVGNYGKGNNIIREVKWVPKDEADRLVNKGEWNLEKSLLLRY